MKKKIASLFFLLFFIAAIPVQALQKRAEPICMKTSIILPCHFKHFHLVPQLLENYKMQTVLPDEIVISLTEHHFQMIDKNDLSRVTDVNWPFLVTIVIDPSPVSSPGQNRNYACQASLGDLLICQDADDIPHPQRVEILKYIFENFHADFLIHRFFYSDGSDVSNFKTISIHETENLCRYLNYYGEIINKCAHQGQVAISRAVFETVKWGLQRRGEDEEFNNNVFNLFNYKIFLDFHLVTYRTEFSLATPGLDL
jgi:hypothetical protein